MAKLSGFSMRHDDVDTTQRQGGGPLPDGFYRFEVDEAKDKHHFDNRPGYQIAAVLEIVEPEEFKGRKMFVDFAVVDPDNSDREGKARDAFGRFLKAIDFNGEFDDPDDLVGRSGIAKYGLDKYRSDKQNKRFGRVWAYVYPEDEGDWLSSNSLGESDRQEEWHPEMRTTKDERDERRNSRERDRGGREERGGREDRGSRGSDRGGSRDSDRDRGRDRGERGGRDRGGNEDSRGVSEDDIPFEESRDGGSRGGEERGSDRPSRGGGSNPWNKDRR